MIIRKATLDDIEGIYEVEEDCFSVPWSRNSIKMDLMEAERTLYFVLEENQEIVGYGGAWIVLDEGQITNIAVKNKYRRSGNGAVLVRKLVRELFKKGMTEIFLEVRQSNTAALVLYRRFGFSVKGVRKNYYTDPIEDAYIMSLGKEEQDI